MKKMATKVAEDRALAGVQSELGHSETFGTPSVELILGVVHKNSVVKGVPLSTAPLPSQLLVLARALIALVEQQGIETVRAASAHTAWLARNVSDAQKIPLLRFLRGQRDASSLQLLVENQGPSPGVWLLSLECLSCPKSDVPWESWDLRKDFEQYRTPQTDERDRLRPASQTQMWFAEEVGDGAEVESELSPGSHGDGESR